MGLRSPEVSQCSASAAPSEVSSDRGDLQAGAPVTTAMPRRGRELETGATRGAEDRESLLQDKADLEGIETESTTDGLPKSRKFAADARRLPKQDSDKRTHKSKETQEEGMDAGEGNGKESIDFGEGKRRSRRQRGDREIENVAEVEVEKVTKRPIKRREAPPYTEVLKASSPSPSS